MLGVLGEALSAACDCFSASVASSDGVTELRYVWLAGGVAVPVHRSTPPAVVTALQSRTLARFCLDLRAGPSRPAST